MMGLPTRAMRSNNPESPMNRRTPSPRTPDLRQIEDPRSGCNGSLNGQQQRQSGEPWGWSTVSSDSKPDGRTSPPSPPVTGRPQPRWQTCSAAEHRMRSIEPVSKALGKPNRPCGRFRDWLPAGVPLFEGPQPFQAHGSTPPHQDRG